MKTVWKFVLPPEFEVTVRAPRGSKALLVAEQNGNLCLWSSVDTDQPEIEYHFQIRGTGHPVTDTTFHVGSAVVGSFVWHVFEVSQP